MASFWHSLSPSLLSVRAYKSQDSDEEEEDDVEQRKSCWPGICWECAGKGGKVAKPIVDRMWLIMLAIMFT